MDAENSREKISDTFERIVGKTWWGLWTALNDGSDGHLQNGTTLSTILCYGINERVAFTLHSGGQFY